MISTKILIAAAFPFVSAIVYVLCIGCQRRAEINNLRKQGIAMPKWNWWMGHLLVLKDSLDKLPPDANVYYAMKDLVLQHHADTEIFLMDYWPIFNPVLMVSGPELCFQISNKYNFQKPDQYEKFYVPTVGGPSLISMNNEEWKTWRALFNPGFSAAHMLDLVPSIVDSVEVFCDLLRSKVGTGIFSLDTMTTRLTMDIITKTALDTDLDNQRSEHPISYALNSVLKYDSFWDPRVLLNPIRPFMQWYYSRIMERFIRKELTTRFSEMKQETHSTESRPAKRAKSVIALVLEEHLAQKSQQGTHEKASVESIQLDEGFARIATNQIRLFLYAGNDTTSSTIVYAYHLLQKHPADLNRLRQEHEEVFGAPENIGMQLKENPALLSRCKFTLAVIKETLRLYPPASSLRQGRAGISIIDTQGNTYPTEGLRVTLMHWFVHRNPRFWPRPEEFLPERWLVPSGHELYTSQSTGAYRPFEQGSRNCIGQTLVLNEISVVLAMTVRSFRIVPAYDEYDRAQSERVGLFSKLSKSMGFASEVPKTVMGDRAYQTSRPGAHPADGYPCRVTML